MERHKIRHRLALLASAGLLLASTATACVSGKGRLNPMEPPPTPTPTTIPTPEPTPDSCEGEYRISNGKVLQYRVPNNGPGHYELGKDPEGNRAQLIVYCGDAGSLEGLQVVTFLRSNGETPTPEPPAQENETPFDLPAAGCTRMPLEGDANTLNEPSFSGLEAWQCYGADIVVAGSSEYRGTVYQQIPSVVGVEMAEGGELVSVCCGEDTVHATITKGYCDDYTVTQTPLPGMPAEIPCDGVWAHEKPFDIGGHPQAVALCTDGRFRVMDIEANWASNPTADSYPFYTTGGIYDLGLTKGRLQMDGEPFRQAIGEVVPTRGR